MALRAVRRWRRADIERAKLKSRRLSQHTAVRIAQCESPPPPCSVRSGPLLPPPSTPPLLPPLLLLLLASPALSIVSSALHSDPRANNGGEASLRSFKR